MTRVALFCITLCCLFFQCKHETASDKNTTGTAQKLSADGLLPGYWIAQNPNTNTEIPALHFHTDKTLLAYKATEGWTEEKWTTQDTAVSIVSATDGKVLYELLLTGDSTLQMFVDEKKMQYRKTIVSKNESFEFSGMLKGLAYEDVEILLLEPAYLFAYSAINDSTIQFNVFGQGGKKITATGTTVCCTQLKKGNYFIRAFRRRDVGDMESENAAFRIPYTLLHQ